jgi:hypothetical protein
MLGTIGPAWDGNEAWLVVACAATFAALPGWYGTMFSGFYLALLLILFFLIVRVVSFEWRGKGEGKRWRNVWLWANAVGSAGIALVWGSGCRTCSTASPSTPKAPTPRQPLGSVHRLHRPRRDRVRAPVRLPGCDLPHVEDNGATSARAPAAPLGCWRSWLSPSVLPF